MAAPAHRKAANAAGRPYQLRTAVAAGAAANAAITIAGIRPQDILVSVLEVQPPTGAGGNNSEDRTSVTTVESGDIKIADDTTGNQVVVTWYQRKP